MRVYAFRVPRARPGQALRADRWNQIVDAVNGDLRPPIDLSSGLGEADSRRFYLEPKRTIWAGRVFQVDEAGDRVEENYIDVEHVSQFQIEILPSMLPIQAGDKWLISEPDNNGANPGAQPATSEAVESWTLVSSSG